MKAQESAAAHDDPPTQTCTALREGEGSREMGKGGVVVLIVIGTEGRKEEK